MMDDYRKDVQWWASVLDGVDSPRIGRNLSSVILDSLLGYSDNGKREIRTEDEDRLWAAIQAAVARGPVPKFRVPSLLGIGAAE